MLIAAVALSASAQDNSKYLNVLAVNGLNMREEPNSSSRVLTKVPYGKRVEILEKTKVEMQLGWITDHWYRVQFRGREGFIFGGNLNNLESPMPATSDTGLAAILTKYATDNFPVKDKPVVTLETSGREDTLTHTFIQFLNGYELDIELESDRVRSVLTLSVSIQEAYVLLEALLKQSNNKALLDELRFVKDKDGELSRISNAEGTISIKKLTDNNTTLKVVSFVNSR